MTETRSTDSVVLAACGLSKTFGAAGLRRREASVFAVKDVDLEVRTGETVAIVGESGSGKSTLARLLLRLIEPTRGTVEFEGRDLASLSKRQLRSLRRDIQMIFQDPYASLHPSRTTFEIISEGWRIHKGIEDRRNYRDRVDQLLEQVGLPTSYADMYPVRLSGGERQRVAIARALAMRPKVLILDEPTSALDVSIQAQVIQLLMRLQEAIGLTYLFISHDLALVRLVADRVAVMYHGEIVELGPAEDIYQNPNSDYTKRLLASSPAERVRQIDDESEDAHYPTEEAPHA